MTKTVSFLVFTFFLLSSSIFSETIAGKISFLVGDVACQRNNKTEWSPAKMALPIFEGDAIKTGKASRCEIALMEERMLRFSENTTALMVVPKGDKTQIKASSGTIWVNVKKLATRKNTFEVSTSVATAAIRGTIFAVDCASDKASYKVIRGTVEVLTENPKAKNASFLVNAGEEFTVVDNLDKYMKEQEAELKKHIEKSNNEIEQYQKEQEDALQNYEKEQNEKLESMLQDIKKSFEPLGNGAAFAKRSFDIEKLSETDWFKWNQARDKALGW